MKGIIPARGTVYRLYPLTKVTKKHLLPTGNKPMIYYPIEKFIDTDINDVLIGTRVHGPYQLENKLAQR